MFFIVHEHEEAGGGEKFNTNLRDITATKTLLGLLQTRSYRGQSPPKNCHCFHKMVSRVYLELISIRFKTEKALRTTPWHFFAVSQLNLDKVIKSRVRRLWALYSKERRRFLTTQDSPQKTYSILTTF